MKKSTSSDSSQFLATMFSATLAFGVFLSLGLGGARAADQFFAGDASALTASKWSPTSAGPFSDAFVSGNVANFATVDGFGGGAGGITVSGLNATENFTFTNATGTLLTGGTVATVTVASARLLDLGTLAISSAAGTGFIKSGPGAFAMAGAAYTSGFTLNDGTIIVRGVNTMGAGGSLTINGGAIGANANRDLSGKYTGSITVGGNFQLGVLTSAFGLASDTATLLFNNNIALGAANRTITIGANGTYTLSGIISGDPGVGLTVSRLGPVTNGAIALIGANAHTGKTTISGGGQINANTDLSLGAVPGSPVADQLTLDGGTLHNITTDLTLNINRGITLGIGGGTNTMASGRTVTIPGNITGPGAFTKSYLLGTTVNLTLSGTNDFLGDFTITGGGVRFNSSVAAGKGKVIVDTALRPAGGVANVTLRNTGVASSTLTNDVLFNANNGLLITLDSDTVNTFILSGKFSGVGAVRHGVNSGGTVVLAGDNSAWSGGLTQQRGNTVLGHKYALGTGTLTVTPTATAGAQPISLSANTPLTGANAVTNAIALAVPSGTNWTITGANDLELSGPITLSSSSPTITNNNSGATILSGPISGAGFGLTLRGSGTFTLGGNSTYDGATAIAGGTVIVNGSLANGAVTVASGATLGGSGTIGGTITVSSGGTIGAGSSAGLLTLTNGLNLNAGGTNIWELAANSVTTAGTDFDQISLTGGNLILGGSSWLQIKFIGSATSPLDTEPFWQANRSWKIISLSGSAANPGSTTFTTLLGTNGITAGTFSMSADAAGVYLNYTANVVALPQPTITTTVVSGGNLILQGTNGYAGGSYSVLTSTNVMLPLTSWITNTTGNFNGGGAFSNAIPFDTSDPQRFFRIKQP